MPKPLFTSVRFTIYINNQDSTAKFERKVSFKKN